ncbi:MAG: peptidoglycan DD-metalloendopeptidase family protein [Pseudomonadota bacterium]
MPSLRPAFVIGALASLAAGVVAVAAVSERDRLQSLNVRETVLTAEQGRNLNRLARLLTVLEQFRRDPPPALLVSPDDAVSAVRAAILVKAITPELQRRARLYAAEASEIARQRRLAAVASEALFTADSELAEARLIQPPGQRDRTPLPEDDGEVTPPKALMAPADGPITRRFGQAAPGGGKANGLTLQTASGAKVAAPDAGLVQYVGPVKGWGVILILRLAGGYHLVLAGLDRVNVDVGQSVAAGAPVGWMADGRQTPPELYLEVRERGAPVDPGRWMKGGSGLRPTAG